MADEPAGGAQTGAAEPTEPTQTTAAGVAGGGGQGGEKTFTQAELDKIVGDRLARQRAQFGDVDELKQKAQRLDELEDKTRSESEKLVAAVEKANKAAAAATEREQQALTRANDTLKRAAVITAAAKASAVDPDDVYRLLDTEQVTIGDDGQVTGAEEAVKALLEAKPHLVGAGQSQQRPSGFDGGARGTTPTQQGDSMNDQIRQAAGFGSG